MPKYHVPLLHGAKRVSTQAPGTTASSLGNQQQVGGPTLDLKAGEARVQGVVMLTQQLTQQVVGGPALAQQLLPAWR